MFQFFADLISFVYTVNAVQAEHFRSRIRSVNFARNFLLTCLPERALQN